MKLSDAEWKVMEALWEGSPATVRDVRERIGARTGWAYTTVKTILERMAAKGLLRRRSRDRVGWFEPLVSRRAARRSEVRSLLERAFDGAFGSLLQHLVSDEKLSPGDRRRLEALIEEDDRRRGEDR
ncbi:MAG TPA: BlaI/MecI/CopY family transcriptional regulator, partial [Planctomycetota bacterium]|nr:BlaI/MecI/CopY family transcriptional regulator [Planctomycetota bacterium]